MATQEFRFGFSLRFRNKREPTVQYEKVLKQAGVSDVSFSHDQLGVLTVIFHRASSSQEEAVRAAADQLFQAIPDAILFEAIPHKVNRMTVRRAMMGFPMPWRFLDQGLPELVSSELTTFDKALKRA